MHWIIGCAVVEASQAVTSQWPTVMMPSIKSLLSCSVLRRWTGMLGFSLCIVLCCKSSRIKRLGRTARHMLDWMYSEQVCAELHWSDWSSVASPFTHNTQVSKLAKLICTTYASLKVGQAGLLKCWSWSNCKYIQTKHKSLSEL